MKLSITKAGIDDLMIGLSIMVSSITFFKQPFEGYFHYIIFLIYLPRFISRFGWDPLPFKFILIPVIFSVFGLFTGNCELFGFIKIFVGMMLSITFYVYVFKYYGYDYLRLFQVYKKGAMICCYIGLVEIVSYNIGFTPGYSYGWLMNKWGIHPGGFLGLRLNSIFSEPSQFALMLLPVSFIAMYGFIKRDFNLLSFRESLVVLVCMVLTTSSSGFIGMFVGLIIIVIQLGKFGNFIVTAILGVLVYFLLYTFVSEFRLRVDSAVNLTTKERYTVEDINTSSFVLYNNFHVMMCNLEEHPLTGTGLGSYSIAYEKYSLTRAEDFLIKKGFDNNSMDGNSLLIRSIAELGILALIFWIVFIVRFFRRSRDKDDVMWLISSAVLTIIFGYLLRQGNYFINGFPFFVLFYYYLGRKQEQIVSEAEIEDGEEEVVPANSATG